MLGHRQTDIRQRRRICRSALPFCHPSDTFDERRKVICKTELHRKLVSVTFVSECVKCEVSGELAYIELLLKQT
jgi:hypothetical protein